MKNADTETQDAAAKPYKPTQTDLEAVKAYKRCAGKERAAPEGQGARIKCDDRKVRYASYRFYGGRLS